jgi:hypothetical protein
MGIHDMVDGCCIGKNAQIAMFLREILGLKAE